MHGPKRGGGSCRQANLAVAVPDVAIRGLRGDEEFVSDMLRRDSSCGEAQDIDFAAGKHGGILPTAGVAGFLVEAPLNF